MFGAEIKRDTCPRKYCTKKKMIADSIPSLLALIVVAFFSGNLFGASGLHMVFTILIEVAFIAVMYAVTYRTLEKARKCFANMYICVCEQGVMGVCIDKGYKNREFAYAYEQIKKVTAKGERVFLSTDSEQIVLTLDNARETAALIDSMRKGNA